MTNSHLPPWVESRIVSFLNQASLHDFNRIKDDPSDGPGPSVGNSIAQKILDKRDQLPARRFRNIQQVLQIHGVGEGTIQDLAFSLSIPADKYFIDLLRTEVLPENWEILPYSFVFEEEAEFYDIAHHLGNLTEFVADEIEKIVLEKHGNRLSAQLAAELLEHCPIETSEDSHQASLQMAAWFYRFDADNWFGFQQMWEVCERYLGYFPEWQFRLETYFYKDFPNSGVLIDNISPRDLPVVVNFGEKRITIWTSGLAD